LIISKSTTISLNGGANNTYFVVTRVQADKDMFISLQVFTIPLDPSSEHGMSAKAGIDATLKERMRSEVLVCRPLPEHVEAAREILFRRAEKCGELQ
jgi:3-polyprenyl-4-hydroxybenzoate decarboxylase